MLGVIAAKSMHEDFVTLMQNKLFPRLGVKNTYLDVPEAQSQNYAQGYTATDTPIRIAPGVLASEGYGIRTTTPPQPFGAYVESVRSGRLLFLSGMLPVVNHKPKYTGRPGKEIDSERGCDALRTASTSAVAAARAHLGTLDKVTRVVRFDIYLATFGDFFDQPKVADAASELFESIFGKEKTSARMVRGVASLPLGVPVELEVILEVAEQRPKRSAHPLR
jgi:enamine deaminase RidA (YjgF/YER057c/UK114 family)